MPAHLPPECLHLIVNHLAENNELESLATLILVSKTVCQITLPYIYSNPFRLFERNIARAEAVVKFRHLVRLLLTTSIPYNDCSDLLKAMYEIDKYDLNDTHSRPLKIKYLEYLRHFDLTQNLVNLTSPKKDTLDTFPRLSRYVDQQEMKQKYSTVRQQIPYIWSMDIVQSNEEDDIISNLNMRIRQEMSWVLCHPILDQLQSIAIPVSNLDPYLDAMDRLTSLGSIVFVLDDLLQPEEQLLDPSTEDYVEKMRPIRAKRDRILGLMVEFVRTHTTRYKEVLRQVQCPGNNSWTDQYQTCPEGHISQILACLPALDHPNELSEHNWAHFITNYHKTNLGYVERIVLKSQVDEWYGPALTDPGFLQRCQSLRHLHCRMLHPEIFKWAVQIRQEIASGANMDHVSLPPLETVRLWTHRGPFGSALDDIALAFGPTLKRLMIHRVNAPLSTIQLGYQWHLSVITEVSTYFTVVIIDIDPTFLNRCPTLRIVSMHDALDNYRVREVVTFLPANLPILYLLNLTGTPALSFHPDTLHSTKELRFLALKHSQAGRVSYIPSLFELEEAEQVLGQDTEHGSGSLDSDDQSPWIPRPKWTWDWYLPNLKDLVLTGEFALRFQFRMLQGCPSIESLSLNIMSTNHEQVVRELTEADFTIDPSIKYPLFEQDEKPGDPSINQDEWSLQDITQALQRIPIESLLAIDKHARKLDRRQRLLPIMYRLNGGSHFSREPHLNMEAQTFLWHETMGPLLDLIQDQTRIHQMTVESLDHPHPAVVLKEKRMAHKTAVQSIVKIIKELPYVQHVVVTWIRQLLATDNNSDNNKHVPMSTKDKRLRVPSLRVLNLSGYWAIPDPVLEVMLGQVFRDVRELQEIFCTGFSVLRWLELTQQMPWLIHANSSRVLGTEPVPIEALPESLLTTQVMYTFGWREYSFAAV